jgi:hypothetical protein
MKQHLGFVATVGMIAVGGLATSACAQSARLEDPIPETPRQSLTAIEKSFAAIPTAEPLAVFPQIRQRLVDTPDFLRDSRPASTFAPTIAT